MVEGKDIQSLPAFPTATEMERNLATGLFISIPFMLQICVFALDGAAYEDSFLNIGSNDN